jgi:hypothetical protein
MRICVITTTVDVKNNEEVCDFMFEQTDQDVQVEYKLGEEYVSASD